MKPLSPDTTIDQDAKAIVDFISEKWTPIPNLEAIVNKVKEKALVDARALFDNYILGDYAEELKQKRLAQISQFADANYYDGVCHFLGQVRSQAYSLKDAALNIDGRWYFEDRLKPVLSNIRKEYPEIKKAKPLGWAKLRKTYNDFDGQEEYDATKDRDLFKGSETKSPSSFEFPVRVALPYVMYDTVCQGRNPDNVLVGSIYAHFVQVNEYINAHKACAALDALGLPATPELVFNLNLKSDNPLLRVMIQQASKPYTREDYEQSLKYKAEYDKLVSLI